MPTPLASGYASYSQSSSDGYVATIDRLLEVGDETSADKGDPLGKGKVICPKYQQCNFTEPINCQYLKNFNYLDFDSPNLVIITDALTSAMIEDDFIQANLTSSDSRAEMTENS